jgi:HlyD family secretion protein
VPDQALRYVPGGLSAAGQDAGAPSPQVWLLRNGKPMHVPVSIGLDDDTFTELVSGDVKVGDKVIVSERTASNVTATNGATPTMRFP